MHGFDSSIPHFITCVRGTRIVVTSQIVADMLRVPRVKFPDYLGCDRLRTVSKDEMISSFYERLADWGDRQFTPCLTFAKGPRFMNMVMTFVLHPLSHYNSITEPRARFLLSLIKGLTIDFHYKKNDLLRRTYCGGCKTGRYMSPIAAGFGPAAEHGSIAAG